MGSLVYRCEQSGWPPTRIRASVLMIKVQIGLGILAIVGWLDLWDFIKLIWLPQTLLASCPGYVRSHPRYLCHIWCCCCHYLYATISTSSPLLLIGWCIIRGGLRCGQVQKESSWSLHSGRVSTCFTLFRDQKSFLLLSALPSLIDIELKVLAISCGVLLDERYLAPSTG